MLKNIVLVLVSHLSRKNRQDKVLFTAEDVY